MDINENDLALWSTLLGKSEKKTETINEASKELVHVEHFFDRPVLGKILVLPQTAAESFRYNKPWACISVRGSNSIFTPRINDNNRVGLLSLIFDDIEHLPQGSSNILFNASHANSIWEFVDKVWQRTDLLMVHCAAGISRSAAISQVISETYQPDYVKYYGQLYRPNKLVHRILKETEPDHRGLLL